MRISHAKCRSVLCGPFLGCQERVFPESRAGNARREGVNRLISVVDWAVASSKDIIHKTGPRL